jgi:hypothetical protein
MPRRNAVPETRDERSPKGIAPESGRERPESYAAAALNVVSDDSTAVSGDENDDASDGRGRREETA